MMGDAVDPKTDITTYAWVLVDGEARHKEHPDTFEMPERSRREKLTKKNYAKLIFVTPSMAAQNLGERMWVRVTDSKVTPAGIVYTGTLDNTPKLVSGIKAGDTLQFKPENVVDIESTESGGGGGALVLLALLAFGGKRKRGRR